MIANFLGANLVDIVFANPHQHGSLEVLVSVYAYAIQIYADFSGYTDMAIGLALLLGFRFPQNFDGPYTAESLQDFWRRWHMTLSRWLRDYLYIPLGGNRGKAWQTYRNLMITFLLGGPLARRVVDVRRCGAGSTASASATSTGARPDGPATRITGHRSTRGCVASTVASGRSRSCAWPGSSFAPPRSRTPRTS